MSSPWREKVVSRRLPAYPWDSLKPYADQARAHAGGIVDLSIGTPVDDTPLVAQEVLAAAANDPGYPTTIGRLDTREAIVDWLRRRLGAVDVGVDSVLPVTGSKELIADLPLQLGVGAGDLVVYPRLAYPTYEVGAALAGAEALAADSLTAIGPQRPAIVWVNSPANPSGKILPVEHLRKMVEWCRDRGTLLVSDECYVECVWEGEPVSVLHPDVNGGSLDGIVAVHSMSKRSNLAGYRCAFVAGDPAVVAELLAVRKNLGLALPGPQQRVLAAVLNDDVHVAEQHARYAARRRALRSALELAGFRIDDSEGSLYLWATRDEDCWDSVAWLAERGILVAPGIYYGSAGGKHIRVSFTCHDEDVVTVEDRLGVPG